jgi:hypothetical protein
MNAARRIISDILSDLNKVSSRYWLFATALMKDHAASRTESVNMIAFGDFALSVFSSIKRFLNVNLLKRQKEMIVRANSASERYKKIVPYSVKSPVQKE